MSMHLVFLGRIIGKKRAQGLALCCKEIFVMILAAVVTCKRWPKLASRYRTSGDSPF